MEKANDFAAFFANQLAAPILKDFFAKRHPGTGSFLLVFRKVGPEFGCCWAHVVMHEWFSTHFDLVFGKQIYAASVAALKHFRLEGLTSGATHPSDTLICDHHVIAKVQVAEYEVTADMYDMTGGELLNLPAPVRTW